MLVVLACRCCDIMFQGKIYIFLNYYWIVLYCIESYLLLPEEVHCMSSRSMPSPPSQLQCTPSQPLDPILSQTMHRMPPTRFLVPGLKRAFKWDWWSECASEPEMLTSTGSFNNNADGLLLAEVVVDVTSSLDVTSSSLRTSRCSKTPAWLRAKL